MKLRSGRKKKEYLPVVGDWVKISYGRHSGEVGQITDLYRPKFNRFPRPVVTLSDGFEYWFYWTDVKKCAPPGAEGDAV